MSVRLFVIAVCLLVAYGEARRRVMPWMCLERCNYTAANIQQHLDDIALHTNVLTGVSFELFNLGPDSTLVVNDLSSVNRQIAALGLETWPMVSSFPYPPEFLSWMHQVFANPQPFIDACIKQAKENGFTGFDIDFEPTAAATAQDAIAYANFLDTVAKAFHKEGIKVSVDCAAWSPIWNYTLLGQTDIDRIHVMGTYTNSSASWDKQFQLAISQIPVSKLGIGLQTLTINDTTWQYRVQTLLKNNVQEIDIWDMPIPSWWWAYITQFALN